MYVIIFIDLKLCTEIIHRSSNLNMYCLVSLQELLGLGVFLQI